jgi:hypothetical protein
MFMTDAADIMRLCCTRVDDRHQFSHLAIELPLLQSRVMLWAVVRAICLYAFNVAGWLLL